MRDRHQKLLVILSLGFFAQVRSETPKTTNNHQKKLERDSKDKVFSGFFDEDSALDYKLEAPFEELFKSRVDLVETNPDADEECKVGGKLTYTDPRQKKLLTLQVCLKLRGNMSQAASECSFPKLWVKFTKEESAGTVFEGQEKIGLATHCGQDGKRSRYGRSRDGRSPLREAKLYKMMQVLGMNGHNVREARFHYLDSQTKKDLGSQMPAFFIEDFDALLIRQGAREIRALGRENDDKPKKKKKGAPPDPLYLFQNVASSARMDKFGVAQLYLFEIMAGNTDFFLPLQSSDGLGLNNIKIVQTGDTTWRAIPYDYDQSEFVAPSLSLEKRSELISERLKSLKERIDPQALEAAKQFYLANRGRLEYTVKESPNLTDDEKSQMTEQLSAFYLQLAGSG
jgi:hypothetical protein